MSNRNIRWRKNSFDRLFGEVYRGFGQIDQRIDDIFAKAKNNDSNQVQGYGPYYYGFSITVGPDGKPLLSEFDNVRGDDREVVTNASEPYIDVVKDNENGKLRILAEMPGVTKDDIKISSDGKSVTIKADHDDRRYHVDVPLAEEVNPESAKAKLTNGILEIEVSIKEHVKARNVRVD